MLQKQLYTDQYQYFDTHVNSKIFYFPMISDEYTTKLNQIAIKLFNTSITSYTLN